jgi:hypothetical protein
VKRIVAISVTIFLLIVASVIGGSVVIVHAYDEDNCLFCHRYRGLSYINKEGKFKLLYVTEDLYENSPHGILRCTSCHTNVDKFPHGEPMRVDCMAACHINDPSTNRQFSHRNVDVHLLASIHSPFDKNDRPKQFPSDYPTCKTCHQDPLYRPLAFLKTGERPALEIETIDRCAVCHENKSFLRKFYNHFTSRMQTLRKPKDLVHLCAECHGNTAMMKRHKIENVVESYLETMHGKAVMLGNELAADCIDCHVQRGKSIHDILSMNNPASASYWKNIYKTCSEIGCHAGAALNLAGYKAHVLISPHKNRAEFYTVLFFVLLTLGSFIPLMIFTVLDMLRSIFPNFSFIKEDVENGEENNEGNDEETNEQN